MSDIEERRWKNFDRIQGEILGDHRVIPPIPAGRFLCVASVNEIEVHRMIVNDNPIRSTSLDTMVPPIRIFDLDTGELVEDERYYNYGMTYQCTEV